MATPNAPLSVGAYGPSVTQLHSLLRQQGFSIPESEVNRRFFGPITRQAVQDFQKKVRLPATGEVDERTDSALQTVAGACVETGVVAEPATPRSIPQQVPATAVKPPVVGQLDLPASGESREAESRANAGSGHYPIATHPRGRLARIFAMLFCILAGIAVGSLRRRKGS
jgi:peptidoglycan hydrolase-like protein with peptidoglycan-binding domain